MNAKVKLKTALVRYTLITLGMGVIGSACRKSGDHPPATGPMNMLNGSVNFSVPRDWLLYTQVNKGAAEIVQFSVPNTATVSSPASGSALFVGEPSPPGGSVSNWVANWLSNPSSTEGYVVATNIFCDGKWSTALSSWHMAGEPFAVMDRFGVDRGVAIRFQLAVPVSATNKQVISRAVSDFNHVIQTLKIAGSNSINCEIRHDHGVVWLRHFDDLNTNWMVGTGLTFRTYQPDKP